MKIIPAWVIIDLPEEFTVFCWNRDVRIFEMLKLYFNLIYFYLLISIFQRNKWRLKLRWEQIFIYYAPVFSLLYHAAKRPIRENVSIFLELNGTFRDWLFHDFRLWYS